MANKIPLLPADARADIQGIITSGYNHLRYAYYVPLQFGEAAPAKAWLKAIIPQITTSKSWRPKPNAPKEPPPRALNLAFAPEGLRKLGMSEDAICTFSLEFQEGITSGQRPRKLGDYGDSAPKNWDIGGTKSTQFDALLILNDQSQKRLDTFFADQVSLVEQHSDGVAIMEAILQGGHRDELGKEPFGFTDGMGQPKIAGIRKSGVVTGEFILGYKNGYNYLPMSPLVHDKNDPHDILSASPNPHHPGFKDFGLHGSYLVYRKLEQDVFGFWDFMRRQSLHDKGFVSAEYMVWLAAKMVGRWPSGAPLVRAPYQDEPDMPDKDVFLYADDPEGKHCPFGSHVRRNNPRDNVRPSDATSSLHISDRHRILRRAVRYGEMLFDVDMLDDFQKYGDLPAAIDAGNKDKKRGIHFLAVNANIQTQFEFVQQSWDNNPRFNALLDSRDPIIGDSSNKNTSRLTIPRDPVRVRTQPLPRFVHVRGGAYLFLPSIRAINYLTTDIPSSSRSN